MSTEMNPAITSTSHSGCLPALVRLIWLFFGNFAILISTFLIAKNESSPIADIVFWLLVPALIAIRFFDITKFHGLTGDNQPATLKDWRSYSFILVGVAGLLYVVAKLVAMNRLM